MPGIQTFRRQRQEAHLEQAWARETERKTKTEVARHLRFLRKRVTWDRGRQVFVNLRPP